MPERDVFGLQSERVIVQDGRELRRGWTTGSCAAAAAKAAATLLLTGVRCEVVRLTTPRGIELLLEVADASSSRDFARCAVVKDGGDDTDATHGLAVYAEVSRADVFEVVGGEGVGRVTLPGLSVAVGQAAINPVPRRMIEDALREVAAIAGYSGALRAIISVPGGNLVAEKTFNPRLGIVGGISILGTSGIVEPMSERALIDTIRLDIDTIRASGAKSLLITPGNYGRDFADSLGLTGVRAAKCSNFLGEAIDYATYCEFEDILIVAHVGKLVKVAAGVFNTHSRTADSRAEVFTAHAAICGADTETCRAVFDAKTADAAIAILKKSNIFEREIASISVKIAKNLKNRAKNAEFLMFSSAYGVLSKSDGADAVIAKLQAMGE